MKTRNASWVMPKTAGMESSANARSAVPIASMTISMGVAMRRPSTLVVSRVPS